MDNLVNVGDEVKDQVTGMKGIALSRTEFLYGCVRIGVQSQTIKKGENPTELLYFDEAQLTVIKKAKLKPPKEAIVKI